jgi:hypothetical protein
MLNLTSYLLYIEFQKENYFMNSKKSCMRMIIEFYKDIRIVCIWPKSSCESCVFSVDCPAHKIIIS